VSAAGALQATYGPQGDPFAAFVRFLMLAEGPTDGTLTNPVTTGTLTKDEVSGNRMGLGNAPYTIGSTVSASTSGMPFGTSWIRHPGGRDSDNFIGCVLPGLYHPRQTTMTWDGWFQVDNLTDTVCLFGDDSSFGGAPYNFFVAVGAAGQVGFNIRTGIVSSGTAMNLSTPGSLVTPNVPFHVEVWGDAAGNIGVAVDGAMTTGSCVASDIGTSSFLLGCQNPYFAGSAKRVLTGYSKCMRITEAVRHTGDFTPPASLLAYRL